MDNKSDRRHTDLTGKVEIVERDVGALKTTTAASQVAIKQLQTVNVALSRRLDVLEATYSIYDSFLLRPNQGNCSWSIHSFENVLRSPQRVSSL